MTAGRLSVFCAAAATLLTILTGSPNMAETVMHVLINSRRFTLGNRSSLPILSSAFCIIKLLWCNPDCIRQQACQSLGKDCVYKISNYYGMLKQLATAG